MKFSSPKWKKVKKNKEPKRIERTDGISSFEDATMVARRVLGNPPSYPNFQIYKKDQLFYVAHAGLRPPTGAQKVMGYRWVGARWEPSNVL